MQMCLHDWTKISRCVRNSTPIIAYICIRLDIASPQHLDRLLFAFDLCFFTEKYVDVATPTARTPRPVRPPLCGKVHAEMYTTKGSESHGRGVHYI